MSITAVGVVVPVHNEQDRLGSSLDALEAAIAQALARVARIHTVVVLDSCSDASHEVVAPRSWVRARWIEQRNVGAARSVGFAEVLKLEAAIPRRKLWLATTDADSTVPPDWLSVQLDHANQGANAVVGTVTVDDWAGHSPAVVRRYLAGYCSTAGHSHVHGANLGINGQSYAEVGGIPWRETGEDVALVDLIGTEIVRTAAIPVITSARRDPRAPAGFGARLQSL